MNAHVATGRAILAAVTALGPGPVSGDGLLLEDGVSFLLMEDSSFLLLES